MPRTGKSKRPGRRRVCLLNFLPLINDGWIHWWHTREKFGISPQQFQKILHEKAAYIRAKFLMECQVITQIEGEFIEFRVISDAF